MKRKLATFIVLSVVIFCSYDIYGQNTYDARATEMMNTQDWFALRTFLDKNSDSLNGFIRLCGTALVHTYFNDSRAAVNNWNKLLDQYDKVLDSNAKFGYNYLLMGAYEDTGDYEKGIDVCDGLLETEGLDSLMFGHIRSIRNRMAGLVQFPEMRIVLSGSEASAQLIGEDDLSCEMEWNGCPLPTLFDTGAQVSVLTEEMADRIGVRYVSADPLQATKNDLDLLCAVVDSLSIEGMVIYNMPVYVLKNRLEEVIESHSDDPDVVSRYEEVRETAEKKMEQAVFGIPVMKRFERIIFDIENRTVTFSMSVSDEKVGGSDFCLINNNLYLKYKLNSLDIVSYMDTGMGGKGDLVLYNSYYGQNENGLSSRVSDDTVTRSMLLPGRLLEYECFAVGPLRTEIGDKRCDLTGVEVLAGAGNEMAQIDPYPLSNGFMGFSAMKKMKRITFDFTQMKCWCE